MTKHIARASLQVLAEIVAFNEQHGRFPAPIDLCDGQETRRGGKIRHYSTLEKANLIYRPGNAWSDGTIIPEGVELVRDGVTAIPVPGKRTVEDLAEVHLSPRERDVLYHILQYYYRTGEFGGPNDIVAIMYGRVTNWNRGHMIHTFSKLEDEGFLARAGSPHWGKGGRFTDAGFAFASTLSAPIERIEKRGRRGGGLSPTGGTRFPDMLFSARPDNVIQQGDAHSKLGTVVTKANGRRLQMGLPIATFSLEEGTTCSPECGLRDVCFAGKMSLQKRIRYEGKETDRAVAKAILEAGPRHYRINTVGDFPNQSFFEAVLAAVTVSGSTAFGYTHWPLEEELGATILSYSDRYWDFFSIRASYEHGSREPLPRRAAVVLKTFDPELLRLHNAVPCPENLQRFGYRKFKQDVNCGNCGLCWTHDGNIAFVEH